MKNRLKQLRKHLIITQQDFADRIGIKRNTLANYEIGRNEPLDAVISLICRKVDEYFREESSKLTDKIELADPQRLMMSYSEKYKATLQQSE